MLDMTGICIRLDLYFLDEYLPVSGQQGGAENTAGISQFVLDDGC